MTNKDNEKDLYKRLYNARKFSRETNKDRHLYVEDKFIYKVLNNTNDCMFSEELEELLNNGWNVYVEANDSSFLVLSKVLEN